MKTTITTMLLAGGLALGGCATVNDYGAADKQSLIDAHGNVAGYKQLLRNGRTGEVAAQVRLFTPMHNDAGELIGYEEQTPDGAIIRDLDGRQVGHRFQDARSRGTNTRSKGITVIIGSLYSKPVIAEAELPVTARLVAALSPRDLRAIR